MSENWKIQVSPKVGDTLINLRAETPDEAERILAWATANADTIAATIKAFGGVANVVQSFPGSQVVQQDGPSWSQQGSGGPAATSQGYAPAQQQQQVPAAPAAPQGGKSCVHGPMVYREGSSAKGPWKAYFCGTPKGTQGQCAPEFLPRG